MNDEQKSVLSDLLDAAQGVVNCWGRGDLARAVRGLNASLREARDACGDDLVVRHLRSYTVIGIYRADEARFADDVEAETAEAAEAMVLEEHPDLLIAAVIEGADCEVLL